MFKLANIVVDKQPRALQFPTLYCRANGLFSAGDVSNHIKFFDAGEYDFTTYFNSLSANKYKKYCSLDNFSLHLELRGCAGRLTLMFADQFGQFSHEFSGCTYEFDARENPAILDVAYPENCADMIAFKIEADGEFEIKNSYYYTKIDADAVRDVKLSLCTTTFKKEDYILPNICTLYEEILRGKESVNGGAIANSTGVAGVGANGETMAHEGAGAGADVNSGAGASTNGAIEAREGAGTSTSSNSGMDAVTESCEGSNAVAKATPSDISQNFWVHVVDNGKTLHDGDLPAHPHIALHPNQNAGGAGGFARGMIESLNQAEGITHVLLMDDDVSVSPESIRRTYNMLRLVNTEYENALVSGAMLDIDFPNEQWEDAGRIDEYGHFMQAKHPLNMVRLADCVKNELFSLKNADYAAWWYCVIPTRIIREVGLPLPFFVRSDDTEYGFRCKSKRHTKIMTMNSIGIWHQGFRTRYDAAVERYQTTRNTLMANAFTGCAKQKYFLAQAKDAFKLEIKRFNYKNALLVVEALEDFLAGPEFIMQAGMSEKKFLEKHKTCEQMMPLEDALLQVPEEKRADIADRIRLLDVYEEHPRKLVQRVFDVASWNGQTRTHERGLPERDWVVMPYEGWFYLPEKQSGAKHIFVVDFVERRGAVRHKDDEQFAQLYERFNKAMKTIKGNKHLLKKYRKAAPYVTSEAFWREYLGLDR